MRELTKEELVRCQISLAQNLHEHMLSNRNEWLILGDETGRLKEFEGKKPHRPSRMMWIAIPPDVTLPPLHPFYHGQDAEWFEDETVNALKHLSYNDEVGCFIFTHEEGGSPKNLNSEIANKEHLLMWQFTLPLVLEWVASNSEGNQNVSIFIERVDPLVPGEMPLAPLMQEFVTGLQTRKSWAKLNFKEHSILAKNPLEHLWLGYTDALGHIFNEEIPKGESDLFHSMRKKAIAVPYRQSSLNGTIRQLLKETSSPLTFLKSLSDISKEDVRDYVRPFIGRAIIEARDSLSNSEWQKLFEHFKNSAETIDGQHAAEMIVANLDVDSMVEIFPKEMEKYIFLKSVLGSSNHVGTTKVANKCKVYIDELLDNGLKLSKREQKKLKTLQAGANDNQFDWAHITDFDELAEDADQDDVLDWDEETQHYFGSQALSRALRNNITDLDEALEIENKLRSIHQKDWEYRRRYIYYSELLMMKSEFEEAKRVLEIEFPNHIGEDDNKSHLSDSYYLASLLKACALSSSTELFQEYSKIVLKSLDEKHPSQRIAYWYSRWVNQLLQSEPQEFVDKIDLSILESCLGHLLSLKNYDFFKKEAPGVILACELIDLNKRGLIEEEHESFLEEVLANSEVFANEWVENNYPNEEDWLAPLNFNYR